MSTSEEFDDLRRLRWQCRRGLLELDLLFLRFLEERYRLALPDEQASFRRLLEQPDQVLLAWLQGREIPPNDLKKIVTIVSQ